MQRKKLSSVRLIAICLVVISVIVFSVSAIGASATKREYKSTENGFDKTVEEISEKIENNKKKIDENNQKLNKLKSEIDAENSEADRLNEEVGRLSDYSDGKVCYLTFDDGPSAHTKEILKVLSEHNAKATFFVTGVGETKYMKDIVDSGNTIALHTYSHDYAKIYSSTDAYFDDLNKIHDLVKKETGVDSNIIRFPGGSSNVISKKYSSGIMTKLSDMVEEKGYAYFDWNVDSTDASGNNVAVEKLIKNSVESANMSRICILMHDTDAKKTTLEALPKIIDQLREKGYSFNVLTEDSKGFHHAINN